MEVQVVNSEGDMVWARNAVGGLTSTSYRTNSTLLQIKVALELALAQCKGEILLAQDVDGVLNIGASTT